MKDPSHRLYDNISHRSAGLVLPTERNFFRHVHREKLRSEIILSVGLTNSSRNGLVCSNDRRHNMAPKPTISGLSRAQDVDRGRCRPSSGSGSQVTPTRPASAEEPSRACRVGPCARSHPPRCVHRCHPSPASTARRANSGSSAEIRRCTWLTPDSAGNRTNGRQAGIRRVVGP